jgi:hypothetical protein
MKERRKFQRFPMVLSAHYAIGNNKGKACKITNVSREGTGIMLNEREGIDTTSYIQLDIDVPSKTGSVPALVTLAWIKEQPKDEETAFMAGCQLKKIENEDKWTLLDYAYDDWCKSMERKDIR